MVWVECEINTLCNFLRISSCNKTCLYLKAMCIVFVCSNQHHCNFKIRVQNLWHRVVFFMCNQRGPCGNPRSGEGTVGVEEVARTATRPRKTSTEKYGEIVRGSGAGGQFRKFLQFSENLTIFQKFEKFPEIWNVFKNMNMVRPCLLITLITCLKGHKSLRVLFGSVFQKCQCQCQWVTREPIGLFGDS